MNWPWYPIPMWRNLPRIQKIILRQMDLFSTRSYPMWTILQSIRFWELHIAQNLILQLNDQRENLLHTRIWLGLFVGWLNLVGLISLMKSISCHYTYCSLGLATLCKHYTCLSIWVFTKIAIWPLTLKSLNSLTLLQSTAKSNR